MDRYEVKGSENTVQKPYSISRRLTMSLIGTVSIVALAVSASLYFYSVNEAERGLETRVNEMSTFLTGSLEMPLWNLDINQVESIVKTIAENDLVAEVTITNRSGMIIYAIKNRNESESISREREIKHDNELLGNVRLVLTKRSVQANAHYLILSLAMMSIFILLSLILITGILVKYNLRRPLMRLNSIINSFASSGYQSWDTSLPYLEFQSFGNVLAEMGKTINHQMEDLRSSEERFRYVLENVQDAVWSADLSGKFSFLSPIMEHIYGRPISEMTANPDFWMETAHHEDKDMVRASKDKLLREGRAELEYRIVLPNGMTRWIFDRKILLRDKQGELSRMAGIITDITDRKHAEVEKGAIEAQNRQLQKAESLTRMAGAVAHHFNNQLTAVLGNLELALDILPQGGVPAEKVTSAMNSTSKAAELSRMMLDYLGQTTGKIEPQDISDVCRRYQPMLQAILPKDVILDIELPSPGPTINANEKQIQQVMANLITNAKEAIGETGGTINLIVKTVSRWEIPIMHRFPIDWQPQEQSYICLEITDTGCGISDKDIEKLFDPFFSNKFTGRGLGLPVVLGIVRAHQGAVTVESEPSRGSTFRIFLPISTDEVLKQPDKVSSIPEIERGGIVLLVEDDELVRDMSIAMLTQMEYMVIEAKGNVEVIELFRQRKDEIRFILVDMTSSNMNGWETLSALRKIKPDIPVILTSAYDESQVMAGDNSELPQAFLGKPYNFNTLKEAIHKVLVNRNE